MRLTTRGRYAVTAMLTLPCTPRVDQCRWLIFLIVNQSHCPILNSCFQG